MSYCAEDVRMEALLLREQLRGRGRLTAAANPLLVIDWSNYSAKTVALIQARGVPIDMSIWEPNPREQTSRHWRAVAAPRPKLWRRRSNLHT